jgi:hypothetical protein
MEVLILRLLAGETLEYRSMTFGRVDTRLRKCEDISRIIHFALILAWF